jgi:2-methylisocitrate lyase-like PEP mutase family enzyme
VAQLAELGVRRISLGSGLARVAWGAFLATSREILERGTFNGLAAAPPSAELNAAFEG